MAIDEDFILAMSQGTAQVAPEDTVEPTGMTPLTTPWEDVGSVDTTGLTESPKQTRSTYKRWGSISIFKTVITEVEHTFQFTALETNPVVLGLAYRLGASPTPDATTHIIKIQDDTTGKLDPRAMVFDLIEGTNHARFWCPRAEVTDVASIPYALDKLTAYTFTVTAYPDNNGVAVSRQYLLDAIVNA